MIRERITETDIKALRKIGTGWKAYFEIQSDLITVGRLRHLRSLGLVAYRKITFLPIGEWALTEKGAAARDRNWAERIEIAKAAREGGRILREGKKR